MDVDIDMNSSLEQGTPMPHQVMARDLLRRMNEVPGAAAPCLLDTTSIAHRYHVPASMAQFVRRAARTQLRHEYWAAEHASQSPGIRQEPGVRATRPAAQPALPDFRTAPAEDALPHRDERARVSGYHAVADDLRERIDRGEITGMLPSRLRLATEYAASRATIKRAVEELAAEGILAPHGSEGTEVLTPRR